MLATKPDCLRLVPQDLHGRRRATHTHTICTHTQMCACAHTHIHAHTPHKCTYIQKHTLYKRLKKFLLRILPFTLLESISYLHETQALSMRQLLEDSARVHCEQRTQSFLQGTLILTLDVCPAHIEKQIISFSLRKCDTLNVDVQSLGLWKALFLSCRISTGQYILTLYPIRTPWHHFLS